MSSPRIAGRLLALVIAGVTLLHTGCIEFDRQVMTYRVDTAEDALLIFQNYIGIYGADHEDTISEQEIDQLRSVMETERTFFFANWIFELNVNELGKAAASLGQDEAGTEKERALFERARAAIGLLHDNLTVSNGPLYLDAAGRLCGTQKVRITQLTTVVRAINDGVRAMLERNLLIRQLDPVERSGIERALANKSPFLAVEGNRITLRYPVSEQVFRRDFSPPENGGRRIRALREAGILLRHQDGELSASVGRKEDRVTRIAMDTFAKPYRDNVLQHTQSARIPVEPEYDVEKSMKTFLGATR